MSRPFSYLPRAGLAAGAMGLAVAAVLAIGSGAADSPPGQAPGGGTLKGVAAFDAIADTSARSQALFVEAAKVITNPRCMNCHPVTNRSPTQGDDMHAHVPPMQAGESGFGVAGINCSSCHRPANTTIPGSRIRSIPGAEPWLLAPASMGWQGMTLGQICQQLKDPARNGKRSLADIQKHMSTDHLVGWAWHPGEGRRPAPGTQEEFGALIAAWISTGAECPP